MAKNKHIIIDMGSSRISAMAVEILENGEVRVLSEESKKTNEIKYGVVESPAKCAYTISELVRLLQNSARLNEMNKACISLNAKTMKGVQVRVRRSLGMGRLITEQLVEELLDECEKKFDQFEVEIFDTIPLSYHLDGVGIDNPVGEKASEIVAVYNVIVGNVSIKEELKRCFDRTTSISLDGFVPLGMEALSAVLLEEKDREEGCALINFGASTTTLAIYRSGALQQLLVVPLGGKNITKDIQELGMSEVDAERLKQLKGSALKSMVQELICIKIPSIDPENEMLRINTDFLATIIESRLTEIMTPILKILVETDFGAEYPIVIAGGGAKLNNLTEFLQEKTGMKVRSGNHSDWLSADTDSRFFEPVYAQSIGVALLLHDYLQEHPENTQSQSTKEPTKGTNYQKKKFGEKIANIVLRIWEDDDYLK